LQTIHDFPLSEYSRDIPNDFNVIIEIPMNADPIKYEVDKETGAMFVDRFMSTAMHYPCNYGYIPHTISDDGDPVDVLVLSPVPLITGVVVRCRPIGMLKMERRGRRRRQAAGGADRQAVQPLPTSSRPRPARAGALADLALLRALQGSRSRQVGEAARLGRTPEEAKPKSSTASRATTRQPMF
jgi:hypothetical protein